MIETLTLDSVSKWGFHVDPANPTNPANLPSRIAREFRNFKAIQRV